MALRETRSPGPSIRSLQPRPQLHECSTNSEVSRLTTDSDCINIFARFHELGLLALARRFEDKHHAQQMREGYMSGIRRGLECWLCPDQLLTFVEATVQDSARMASRRAERTC